MPDESTDPAFTSWPDLVSGLLSWDLTGWICRGQADVTWDLQSRLQRSLADVPKGAWKDREDLAIGQFKARARLHLADIPGEDDPLGWLGLMQHYGAPTRLLDWTESPFVAIWFAYAEPDLAADAALWLLNAQACRGWWGTELPGGRDHLGTMAHTLHENGEVIETSYPGESYDHIDAENRLLRHAVRTEAQWPLPLLPPRPDRRMRSQQAVFTLDGALSGIPFPLTQPGLVYVEGEQNGGEVGGRMEQVAVPVVQRLSLPKAWRTEALESLRLMGISAESIFPGLDGVGRDISLSLDCDLRLGIADVIDQRLTPKRHLHS